MGLLEGTGTEQALPQLPTTRTERAERGLPGSGRERRRWLALWLRFHRVGLRGSEESG